MSKKGEIEYLKILGKEGRFHALNKPFSDDGADEFLIKMGIIFKLLPPPPGKLLDLGCGSGWTSCFFAKRGYEVTGIDLAPDMIECAEENKAIWKLENLEFHVMDYEQMNYDFNFDCAVFFDSLHHASDEAAALRNTCKALLKGGKCILLEPGAGHGESKLSKDVMAKFDVTEKEMPPYKICDIALNVGFTKAEAYPSFNVLTRAFFSKWNKFTKFYKLTKFINADPMSRKMRDGIVVLEK